jgi:flagellar motor protein MotB
MHSGDQERLWPGNLPSIAKRIAFWTLCTAAIVSASIVGFSFVHGGRDAEPTTTDIQSEISNGTKAPAIPGSVIGGSEALTKLLQSKDQVWNPDPLHPPNPLRSPEPDLSVSDPAQTVETGVRDAVFAGQPKAEASQKSEAGQSDAIEQLTQAAAAPPDLAHEPFSLVAQSPSAAPAIITLSERPHHLVPSRRCGTAITTKCGIRSLKGLTPAAPIGSAETEPHLDTAPPEASEPPKATLNALAPVDRGSSSSVSAPASVRAQKQDPLISPRAHTLSQLKAAVRAEKTDRGLRVILHSDKLFGSSADTLSEEIADRDLKIISELLAAQRWRQIIVIGHEDKEQLAKQRANAVSAWLQAHASQHRPDFVEDARVRRAGKRQEARIEILLRHR